MSKSSSRIERIWAGTKHGRTLVQLLFLGLTVWVSYQVLTGVRGATVEKYCPFGGVETLLPWLQQKGTLCSLSTINISILIGVVLLTLLCKRVFCSHVCPMGTVLEWTGALSRKWIVRSWRLPRALDRALTWLKYPILVLIIALTAKYEELIFRDFDPYFVLFTAGKGHGIGTYGVWVTGAVLLAAVVVPLSFCRYLCPMAAVMAPLNRLGLAKVHRHSDSCSSCGACDGSCKWGIPVSEKTRVSSAECSNCLDCVRACPVPGTLELRAGGKRT